MLLFTFNIVLAILNMYKRSILRWKNKYKEYYQKLGMMQVRICKILEIKKRVDLMCTQNIGHIN